MSMPNKFTRNEGPWHNCGVCEDRKPIKDLQWQNAVLKCERCYDKFPSRLGQIDKLVSDALMEIIVEPDLQPDPKLTQPSAGDAGDILL